MREKELLFVGIVKMCDHCDLDLYPGVRLEKEPEMEMEPPWVREVYSIWPVRKRHASGNYS